MSKCHHAATVQRSREFYRIESTKRLVLRGLLSGFGGEKRIAGGNAAAWNLPECGAIQTEVEPARKKEAECEEMELLCRSQETRKIYVSQAEMCRDKDGSLLTDKR